MALGASGGGGGSKSNDVRAGGAYVEVSAKDSLSKTLAGLNVKVQKFAAGLRSVGGSMVIAGSAALAPIAALFKGGVDRAEGIGRMAKELNVTVDMMQRLQYAADVTGNSIDDIMKNPGRFADIMASTPMMDAQTIKDATSANQEFRKTWLELQMALVPLISTFAPLIKQVGQFVRDNAQIIRVVAAASAAIVALGVAFVAAGAAITGVVTVGGAIVSVIGMIASPIGLLVVAVGAVATSFLTFKDTAIEAFGGISAAIQKGDFSAALKVATSAAYVVWVEFLANMETSWIKTKSMLSGSVSDLKYIFGNFGIDFAVWLGKSGLAKLPVTNRQIDIGAAKARNELGNKLDSEREANKTSTNAQLAAARADLDRAKADLNQKVAEAKKPGAVKGGSPIDTAYFAGIASRGAFRVTGDSRQFGEGGGIARETLMVSRAQLNALNAIEKQQKDLNKNLKLQ